VDVLIVDIYFFITIEKVYYFIIFVDFAIKQC